MGETNKRKIKKVNGYKVNHPFSVGNMFFAFFTLVLIALPVGMLFLPVMSFPDYPDVSVTGLDIIKYGIIFIFENAGLEIPAGIDVSEGIVQFITMIESNDALLQMENVFGYIIVGQAGIIALLALNSLILLPVLIVNLCKGYLRHSKVVKVFASFDFTLSIFFSLSFVAFLLLFAIVAQQPNLITIWFGLIPAGAALVLLIIISSIRNGVYEDVIFEKDLVYKEDEKDTQTTPEKEVVQEVNVHTITVTNYEPANSLRPDVQSIGDHEYSQDQNLIYANIPEGITKLGAGAFANCLKLRLVSIPTSVKNIGFNCFFNCISLERLNYAGTKEQWSHVVRGSNWLAKAKTTEVICVDGTIVVNPFH